MDGDLVLHLSRPGQQSLGFFSFSSFSLAQNPWGWVGGGGCGVGGF